MMVVTNTTTTSEIKVTIEIPPPTDSRSEPNHSLAGVLTEDPRATFNDMRLNASKAAQNTEGTVKPSNGETATGALVGGELVGLGSRYYGPYMQNVAPELGRGLSRRADIPRFAQWLDDNVIRKGLEPWENRMQKELPEVFQDKVARASNKFLYGTERQLAQGLYGTANAPWEAESWGRAAFKGGAVAIGDWALNSAISEATGNSAFKPNILETSLVTAATISPIPGKYKLAAIAGGWAIGKLSNLVGMT